MRPFIERMASAVRQEFSNIVPRVCHALHRALVDPANATLKDNRRHKQSNTQEHPKSRIVEGTNTGTHRSILKVRINDGTKRGTHTRPP